MRELHILATSFVVAILSASSFAEDQVAEAIERLANDRAKVDRIAAAQWLRRSEDARALQAIDALTATCKDADADVRNASVLALGFLCERHGRVCPLALIEAMFDSTERIRTNVGGLVSLFKDLPRGAVNILLQHAAHPISQMRGDALISLGRAGASDPVAIAVLRQAVHDRDVMVRTHAVAGLWHATNDLSEVVPHWLLFTQEGRLQQRPTNDQNDQAANTAAIGRDLAGK